jgi:putative ABC transport system ATP-binding protein
VALTVSPGVGAAVAAELTGADAVALSAAYDLEDVIRIYRVGDTETIALRGIDLAIPRGSFLSVMGRSGSGKSTLLALLAGADRPSAGRVMFGDIDLGRAPEAELQRIRGREVSLLFQADNLVPFLSVAENMRLAGDLAGKPLAEELIEALLARVGLAERADHRPAELSGGEQQRAALACVLASASPVVLMDEPTAELDSGTAARVLALVRELQEDFGLTIVLATHDRTVAEAADRSVVLASGRVVEDRSDR